MIYVCRFRRQSDNNKITRPRSIQIVKCSCSMWKLFDCLVWSSICWFYHYIRQKQENGQLQTGHSVCYPGVLRFFYAAKSQKTKKTGTQDIFFPRLTLFGEFCQMEGQSHIPSCNSISAVGFIKGQSLKNSSLFRRRRDLGTSSRRRVLDIVWTVSLPVISKKKDVPKVSSHWFICRIRGCIYGLVGEYIQLMYFAYWQVLVSLLFI